MPARRWRYYQVDGQLSLEDLWKETAAMNQYGTMAQRHWQRWLPRRYAAIGDPGSYFPALWEEAAQRIAGLSLDLAGDDPPGEGYLEKVGRLNMARLQAEEIVLTERVLLEPEPGADPDPSEAALCGQSEPGLAAGQAEVPLVVDRSDPRCEQVNAEQEEVAQDR